MKHPGFFAKAGPFRLQDIAEETDSVLADGADPKLEISDILPLDEAGGNHLSFFDNMKYLDRLARTEAGACFLSKRFAEKAPADVSVLLSKHPYRSFAKALIMFYPESMNSITAAPDGPGDRGFVHSSAKLEEGVVIEPGAVIGPEAQIGEGTRIAAGTMIGGKVCIGRNCIIGPNVTVIHALVGNRVRLHSGVSIGQDGFGFAMSGEGHLKVPQIGRVLIQDDVDIGANTAIDRGALRDTVIGEGTKIDNLCQIAHNVVIGRHCVVAGQTGIAGSTELEDFVVIGGQVGVVGHITIGKGAAIAATSNVNRDVPPGSTWGGTPAKPMRIWFRELAILRKMAEDAENQLKKKLAAKK